MTPNSSNLQLLLIFTILNRIKGLKALKIWTKMKINFWVTAKFPLFPVILLRDLPFPANRINMRSQKVQKLYIKFPKL